MIDWIWTNETLLWCLVASSVITFVGSLLLVPWLLVRIPTDYFSHRRRHHTPWADRQPLVRGALLVLKNGLGGLFFILGVAMLVLPGQGILTMLVGIVLMDFPGKYRFERWIISRPAVLRTINWLRRRAHREPLTLDE